MYDNAYLRMELALPRDGDVPEFARVNKCLKDTNGFPIGTVNRNPVLDTQMYDVQYQYGYKASLTANTIAQNIFAQVDEDGNRHVLFDEIIDHCSDGNEVKQQDTFIATSSSTNIPKDTTRGWDILVQWKDGSTTWVALNDDVNSPGAAANWTS